MRFSADGRDYGSIATTVPERSVRARAEELPFKDGSFDVVISTKAVGWYPRQIQTRLALREMLRVCNKETGYSVFNIGQEMTPDIINPVLLELAQNDYFIKIINNCWCLMRHPEFKEPE